VNPNLHGERLETNLREESTFRNLLTVIGMLVLMEAVEQATMMAN
jgi:hypothetical protein